MYIDILPNDNVDLPTMATFKETAVGRLVSGGEHGLRLQRISGPGAAAAVIWDVMDKAQWGEPFLLCLPGTETM